MQVETGDAEWIESALDYRFDRIELLLAALTHRSWANERGGGRNYERLEFLGDAVLGLVTSEWLFERHPDRPEGELAKLKSFLVSAPVLSSFAESIGVGERLRLGVGEDRSGGRRKTSILADAMEALVGALYLDGGLETARTRIRPILERAANVHSRFAHTDAKTALQETAQGRGWGLPTYQLVDASGPDHAKRFRVECRVDGKLAGVGDGRSKKMAEQRSAAAALAHLDLI